ncbi:hypothetical protein GCM10009617_32990 [Leifsonia poae]|uniref:Uncharacterized protein n=1 Tax=Leifsonia poae TaxID=110933 RepID=A0A9W6H9S3_9MICO|nr:hypothetical protein GCM10017584_16870 [Leifsonia poae]
MGRSSQFGAKRYSVSRRLLISDSPGTLLAEYPQPAPGTKCVGSGTPEDQFESHALRLAEQTPGWPSL